jgi:hypothetical protein
VADGAGVIRALNEAARWPAPSRIGWPRPTNAARAKSPAVRSASGSSPRTRSSTAQDALAHEQERTAFLSESSAALLGSLNLRCMEVAARLAAEHLADAAMVLAPATGGSYSTGCRPSPAPSRT